MKQYLKYLLILPPVLVGILAVCLSHSGTSGKDAVQQIPAADEAARLSWLAARGLDCEAVSSRAVTVPLDFSGVYGDYAALQEALCLPLEAYSGQRAVLYTYQVKDSEPLLYAELLTAEGILIGAQCYRPEESATLDLKGNLFTAPPEDA